MTVVGSAEVIVRAITNKVRDDISKAFNDARPAVQAAGRDAGKDYAGAFNQTLSQRLAPQMKKSMEDASKIASEAAIDQMNRTLPDGLGQAGAAAGRSARDGIESGMRGGGGGNPLRSFTNWFKDFDSGAAAAGAAMTNLIAMGNFMGAALSGIVGMLSSVVSGLFAMGAAAMQAASAIAVLPGLLGVVGQAFAAVKLGFAGVGQAVKLGSQAQAAATGAAAAGAKSSGDAIAAAKKLQKAQDRLTQAQKEAKEAQDALNKARDKASMGVEEQEEAEARLAEAVQHRNALLKDPNASAGDAAAAQKAVDDAKAALDAIRKERGRNQKEYDDALRKNEAAQKKVAAAEKARDAASKKSRNAGNAATPAVKAAQAYQNALAKLTPEAQAFVRELLEMKKGFKEVSDAIAREMFPPLTEALQLIGDSSFFTILKNNLSTTGGIVGEVGLQMAQTFTTKPNMTLFQTWLKNNNEILGTLATKTKDGTTPVQSLTNIILKLGIAIQPITKRFVDWTGAMVTAFDKAHSIEDISGYFGRAGDRAAQLGRIIGNIAGALGNLAAAALPAGDGLMASFENATAKFEEFTNKIKDDPETRQYFEDVADNLRDIGNLINTITSEFTSLGDNKGIGDLAQALEPAVENFAQMFDNFNKNGDSIGKFAEEVTEFMLAFTDSKGIELFFDTLNGILGVVNDIIEIPGIKQGLGLVAAFTGVSRAIQFAHKMGNFFVGGLLGGLDNTKKNLSDTSKIFSRLNPFKKRKKGNSETDEAVDDATDDTADAKNKGKTVGEAIADGIAEGIGDHAHLVIEAIDELVTDLITQVKKRLDINSPSRVMAGLGENTAEGFVQGIRSETDDAYKAGAALADAAADGANSKDVVADVRTTGASAKDQINGAAGKIGMPDIDTSSVDIGMDSVSKKFDDTEKKSGRLKKGFGALGGGLKALSGGLLGLVGGPIGALMLLVTGLTTLYQKSPEFKKFVDNIIKAVMPIAKAIGKWVLGTLDKVFAWVNKNMPTIKAVFSTVFKSIGSVVGAVFGFIKGAWEKVLKPVFGAVALFARAYFGLVKLYIKALWTTIKIAFSGIKIVWENVLKPVFNAIKNVAINVFGGVRRYINAMKNAFVNMKNVLSAAKDGVVSVFNSLKDAAKKPIKWVIDTVWNNGLVNMADKIPGVDASKWKVNTSGWASGGWTGAGNKYDVAGLVHADEFVIKKSSRRAFENVYPGLLDYINRNGSLPSGHAAGGKVPGYAEGGAVKKLLGGVKWTKNLVVDGVKWTYSKAKAMLDAVKAAASHLTNLPSQLSAEMSKTAWGRTVVGVPKASTNEVVSYLNRIIPNGIPGIKDNPFKKPFPGVEFRASGGRVRKGMPYVVGELQPELFVPDANGSIIPSLKNLSSKRTVEGILNQIESLGGNTNSVSTTNNSTGARTINVNVNNPTPERSSQSVSKVMKSRAISNGWGM